MRAAHDARQRPDRVPVADPLTKSERKLVDAGEERLVQPQSRGRDVRARTASRRRTNRRLIRMTIMDERERAMRIQDLEREDRYHRER